MSSLENENDPSQPDNTGNGNEPCEVGYGKPPKHGQFKPGNQKGTGRPRKSKNIKSIVNAAASEKVAVKVNGKIKKVPKGVLAIHQVFNKGAAGDHKSAMKAIELQERYGPQEDPVDFSPEELQPDIETLRKYLAWQDTLYPPEESDADDE